MNALSCTIFSLHYFTTMFSFFCGMWPDPKRYRFQGLGSGSWIRPEIQRNQPVAPETDPTPIENINY